jgi:sarcosine oxidase, subunit beta
MRSRRQRSGAKQGSRPDMPPRVGIIGAGVAGLSVAMQLTSRGIRDVTVLEAAFPASGSSGLSVGDVSALYETTADIDWRLEALRFFQRIGPEIGLSMVGGLRIVYTGDDQRRLAAAAAEYADRGVPAQVITPHEARQLVPDLCVDDVAAALATPLAGHLDATLLCRAYRARAESAGARVITSAPVVDAELGARSIRLRTPAGSHQVDVVVNAAGPWAGRIAGLLGTHAPAAVSVPCSVMATNVRKWRNSIGSSGWYVCCSQVRWLAATIAPPVGQGRCQPGAGYHCLAC